MEKDTNNFAKGVFVKLPNRNAPDFVLLNVSIKPRELAEWAQQFVTEQSKGWVNLQVLRSKDGGTIYMAVDTYVAKTDPDATKEYNDNKYQNVLSNGVGVTSGGTNVSPTYKHADAGVQAANEKTAEQLFNRTMTEEEEFNLSNMHF